MHAAGPGREGHFSPGSGVGASSHEGLQARDKGLERLKGLRQLRRSKRASERATQSVRPALGLSSVRGAAAGVFPDWGGVQFHFADEEVRHGEETGLGWVTHMKGKGYPFLCCPGSGL